MTAFYLAILHIKKQHPHPIHRIPLLVFCVLVRSIHHAPEAPLLETGFG